jgi:hypothetical protein
MSGVEAVSDSLGIDLFRLVLYSLMTALFVHNLVRNTFHNKRNMSPEELQSLYQETGAPLHSAYALPQLLAFYNNDANRGIMSKVYRWQTISSICIHRWMGGGKIDVPISYSEAR